jgi:hypothetical protein
LQPPESTRPAQLDLSKGSILHVEEFRFFGSPSKDKYIYIIGHEDAAHVFEKWAKHPLLSREPVHVPKGCCRGLPRESWIQCFYQVHRLSVSDLQGRFERHHVKHKGKLGPEFLAKVRRVVEFSEVLKAYEIEDCLDAIDKDKAKM